jgi:hypothetical protein
MIEAIALIMWPHVIPFIPTLNNHSNNNKLKIKTLNNLIFLFKV